MKSIIFKLITLSMILVLLLSVGLGCTSSAPAATREVLNGDGSKVQVPYTVNKVAALFGPSFEKIAMLGAEDKIVACSESHQKLWPWSQVVYKNLKNVPTVSISQSTFEVNAEELLKIKPDLVFNWSFPQSVEKIKNAGIPVIYPANSQKVGYPKEILAIYAAALGKKEEVRAAEYNAYYDQKINMVSSRTQRFKDSERPRVFFAMGDPLKCDGNASPLPTYISLAGGKCVHGDIQGNFGVKITMEQLVLWDPEFIILDMSTAPFYGKSSADQILASISQDSKFKNITAVKNNNVYTSPSGVFFWSAGQQVILQVMWLAKMLHPDTFKDLDMNAEVKSFYSKFFNCNLTDEQVQRLLTAQPPK